jgi:hypothetical protein
MGGKGEDFSAIEITMLEYETLERLKRAIEISYRRLFESAATEWEQRFAGQDPSDACVRVRISSITTPPGDAESSVALAPPSANGTAKFDSPRVICGKGD